MRKNAWRNWMVVVGGAGVACGVGAGCGGDDSVQINTPDGGGDVTSGSDAGDNDGTTGNDGGSQIDSGNDTGTKADTGNDTGTSNDGSANDGNAGDGGDAAVACSPANSACSGGGVTAGLCKSSVCTACTDPTDDSLCSAAYADGGAF